MNNKITKWCAHAILLGASMSLVACGGSSSDNGSGPQEPVTEKAAPSLTTPGESGTGTPSSASGTPAGNWVAPVGVTGSVGNAFASENLEDVEVQVFDSSDFDRGGELPTAASFTMQPLFSVYTDADGQFTTPSFGVDGHPVFRYLLDGYEPIELYYTAPAPEADDNSTLQLEPVRLPTTTEMTGTPDVAGKITDALTGLAIQDATVKLFRDGNTSLTADYTLTTGSDGRYTQSNVEPGVYAAVISAEDYITTTRNTLYAYVGTTSDHLQQNKNLNFTVTPVLAEGVWRIVLTWGEHPSDLDSHIWAPSEGLTAENCSEAASGWEADKHIFYGHRTDTVNSLNLDVDDTSSYGPETITITDQQDGTYYYSIHHYSGADSIAKSDAKIEVYNGSELKKTYYAPTTGGEGKYIWEVFNLNDNTITSVNTYQTHTTGGTGPACPREL